MSKNDVIHFIEASEQEDNFATAYVEGELARGKILPCRENEA
jgi:hypothetical protein